MYRPAPEAALLGAGGVQATLTGFQGAQRQHILQLLRAMGVHVQKSMLLATITHVVANDTGDTTSNKLVAARRCAPWHRACRPIALDFTCSSGAGLAELH